MLLLQHIDRFAVHGLLDRYGLQLQLVAPQEIIPGSYWGEREAGLIGDRLYARLDTPVHSVLHESAHFVCMSPERRSQLHTDAQGEVQEETAVCYLQVLMGDELKCYPRQQMFQEMDEWGYSFRLGSAALWFHLDADDARLWLAHHLITDQFGQLTFQCCQ